MPSLEFFTATTTTAAAAASMTTIVEPSPEGTESEAPSQRRVSPPEAPSAKKQQQRKVNQLTLNNFFHKGRSSGSGSGNGINHSMKKKATTTMTATTTTTTSSVALTPPASEDDASKTRDCVSPPSSCVSRNHQHGSHVVGVEVVELPLSSSARSLPRTLMMFPQPAPLDSSPRQGGGATVPAAAEAAETSRHSRDVNEGAATTTARETMPSLRGDPTIGVDDNNDEIATTPSKHEGEEDVDSRNPCTNDETGLPTVEGTNHSKPVSLGTATSPPTAPARCRTRKRKATPQAETGRLSDEPLDSLAAMTTKKTAPRKKKPVVVLESAADQSVPDEPLSEERLALLNKHADMIQRCQQRSKELVLVAREGLEEEDYEMPQPEIQLDLSTDDEFPDAVVHNMAVLIEGSHLPLSELTCSLRQKLRECHGREWSEEPLSNKIKLIAERKPFLDNAAIICKDILVKYEDNSPDRLWRWELGLLDILPSTVIPLVRKARTACRKLLSHYMANEKLLKSLQEADAIVRDTKSTKLEPTLVKIGKDEEKVLKFEREAEKLRLVQLAQKKKEQEVEDKKIEKERKKEEAEKKRLEKEREKQEAADAREAERRKKLDEKDREKQEKLQKEEKKKVAVNKQQACLMSFLALQKEAKARSPLNSEQTGPTTDSSTDFDSKRFRSLMDSQTSVKGPLFPTLSASATHSRKRRTRRFPLSVYVTVMPDANAFDEQPFAEPRTVHVPNKFRFLSFHEDYRPAYRGTWSKRSTIVTGKTPFGKDSTCLDYDYDSEVEWEEGDDEIGEDVDDDSKNQEEEEEDNSAKVYDYDDGFCVADDQYLDTDEDMDEETKALYRKKLQKVDAGVSANRICIVGPSMGGLPPSEDSILALLDGFEKDEALDLLKLHKGKNMSQDLLWLDAFAPDNIDELDPSSEPEKPIAPGSSATNDEYTVEEIRTLASFVHHNSLNSKDKLIDELRNANPNVFDSRAKATRKLVSIAEKKKHPSGTGVYWEVNKAVLTDLELHDVLAKTLPGADTPPPISKKRKDTDTSEDPDNDTNVGKTGCSKSAKKVKLCSPNSKPASLAEAAAAVPKAVPFVAAAASPKVAAAPPITNFLQPRKKPKNKVNTTIPPPNECNKEISTILPTSSC